ncbi:MaoC family dehydratase [Haloarchaeobius amylolyticus]|uniref:MaoC family dehydratase n=1 Tax=Haloarchaeobius amylolyticus TaxID=1198296 RepID=UPI002271F3BF|nr:MaoC family dehydratase [Haloarchaeobius amylolyticus]
MEYFEDISVGDTREYGSYVVDGEEITDFGQQYDPQPFHTDAEAAAQSFFGGLVASGWHTGAMTMRLLVEGIFPDTAALGAVGVDELRWPNPTRPGDELHVETEVLEKQADYRPGVGLVLSRVETKDEGGEVKQSFVGRVMYEQRE